MTVPAASQATVEIEATAVSNGAVAVAVTMRSTAGVLIGAQANADVNVQAGWETPIVAAAVAALALLLVVGIVRTVRRNRRGGAADDTDAAGGTGEAARTDGTGGTDG